jgi:hypothetical protein
MHAQPWRLLVLAFLCLIVIFWFQTSIDSIAGRLDKMKPDEHHFEDYKRGLSLVNNLVGAFAGALIGTAITNRAMLLNSVKLKELKVREEKCQIMFMEAEEIKTELNNQNIVLSAQVIMQKHKLRMRLLDEYITEMNDIRKEEKSLRI